LNPYGTNGIPTKSDKFVKFIAERMAKIISKSTSEKVISDLVFPSLEEISHTIIKGCMNKKEVHVYKLILDFYEALYNTPASK